MRLDGTDVAGRFGMLPGQTDKSPGENLRRFCFLSSLSFFQNTPSMRLRISIYGYNYNNLSALSNCRGFFMDLILPAICLGLHTLATVILTGQYFLSALVILPVLKRQASEQDQARLLAAFTARRLGEARDAERTSPTRGIPPDDRCRRLGRRTGNIMTAVMQPL
jgi:hypothetical protein